MRQLGWMWLAAALVGSLAVATGAQGQRITLLAKGGVNSATVAWSPSPLGTELEGLERRVGFSGGLAGTVDGPGPLRFHLEGLLTEKGFVERGDEAGRVELNVRYLEIPLLVGVAPEVREGWLPEVYAGPWLALEASCQIGARSPLQDVSFDCDEVPDDPVLRETWDYGVAVGGLVDAALTPVLRARADVRYTHGLRNVDGAADIDNIDVRHRGIAVALGFGWALGS